MLSTRSITNNYNLQCALWDAAYFVSWASGALLAVLSAVLGFALDLLIALVPAVVTLLSVLLRFAACVVVGAVVIVAVILTGGWAVRWFN